MRNQHKTILKQNLNISADESIFACRWDAIDLEGKQIKLRFQVRPEDREILAQRFDVIEFSSIEGVFDITQPAPECWQLVTTVTAQISQQCVVSFVPVHTEISFSEHERFVVMNKAVSSDNSDDEEGMEIDEAEPLENGAIPLGETLAQHIALHLPLLPRSQNADKVMSEKAQDAEISPFHMLSELKKTE